jgi:hypothetical protein
MPVAGAEGAAAATEPEAEAGAAFAAAEAAGAADSTGKRALVSMSPPVITMMERTIAITVRTLPALSFWLLNKSLMVLGQSLPD